jgi:ribosomal RNA assembly protein
VVEMLYDKVPMERIGALIGQDGKIKKMVEERSGAKILIDSHTGEVTIDESDVKNPVDALKARDFVKAVGRGFSDDRAARLLDEDNYLEVIDIKEFTGKSKSRMNQVRGRLIGYRGKTRRIIEELTGAELSIYGNTISIIGGAIQLDIAKRAVVMVLKGSEHSTVYRFLERKRAELKIAEMGF